MESTFTQLDCNLGLLMLHLIHCKVFCASEIFGSSQNFVRSVILKFSSSHWLFDDCCWLVTIAVEVIETSQNYLEIIIELLCFIQNRRKSFFTSNTDCTLWKSFPSGVRRENRVTKSTTEPLISKFFQNFITIRSNSQDYRWNLSYHEYRRLQQDTNLKYNHEEEGERRESKFRPWNVFLFWFIWRELMGLCGTF